MKNIIWDFKNLTGSSPINEKIPSFLSNQANYLKVLESYEQNIFKHTHEKFFSNLEEDYPNLYKILDDLADTAARYNRYKPYIVKIYSANHEQAPEFGGRIIRDDGIICIKAEFLFEMIKSLIFEFCNASNISLFDVSLTKITHNSTEKDFHQYAYEEEKAEHDSSTRFGEILYEYLSKNKNEIMPLFRQNEELYNLLLNDAKLWSEISFEDSMKIISPKHTNNYAQQARGYCDDLKTKEESYLAKREALWQEIRQAEQEYQNKYGCKNTTLSANEELPVSIGGEIENQGSDSSL